jgi:DNA gyrase subunit B
VLADALRRDVLGDPGRAGGAAAEVARRLDALSPELERGWVGEPSAAGAAQGLMFSRELRGVREAHVIDSSLLDAAEARRLAEMAPELSRLYAGAAALERKDGRTQILSPTALFDAVLGFGRKGVSMQRYKGLGEMNPDQLWETTLDPNVRTLLQVKVAHADTADEMFTKLMGDVVEPRREFIQSNALAVANLDV